MARLEGKVALVTGAGGAIGRAVAVTLAREGAAVVATDLDAEAVAQTATALESQGAAALGLAHDVSHADSWLRVTGEALARFGRVDILHNNAAALDAIAADGDPLDVSLEVWNHTLAVNLTGTMLGCRQIIPTMVENGGGSIVNTSSTAAIRGHAILSAYAASKAALHAFTRSVATAYGKQGIRCNIIAPGWIRSPRNERGTTPEELDAFCRDHFLTPRLGEPGDIAEAVLFLGSDESSYITGQVLAVDGGYTVRGSVPPGH